ncbi:DNA primase [Prosthecochloris sp. CIB 2401]|uniref:DNA primase n=1 Tax=Prosthecochloris sp. CIB 2401 TaxID=1868325 RepID=UPI00080A9831|nr:DNA primase [Prosthecochloris sp. CIB 2401]ANT65504.1 DNA primase [Prosthecochloris sp. CIB 2401]
MIPQKKIDEIRQSVDIADVISDYVQLRPSGRNFKALSPFTTEKTPSFVVSTDKQIFKCFSSGKGGNVFTFLMEMEKISFPEAAELLAKRAGIDISSYRAGSRKPTQEEQSDYETLKWAGRLYNRMLHGEQAQHALDYLTNKRGLSRKTITSFGLGYAPDSWDFLLKQAATASILPNQLARTGLLYRNERKQSSYDYFRERIMFPIFSVGGQVVGFGGRTLKNDKDTPKYLNSPETALFEKSKVLYGLHAAKDAIRKKEEAILVEGYMDVLALHQAGIPTAVASCGTALTPNQASMLMRYCKQVLFLYDGDEAGLKSMLGGIHILLRSGLTPAVATLPPTEDPDSYIKRHGREQFETYIQENRLSFIDFQLKYYNRHQQFENPEKKAAAIREMLRAVSLVPDTVRRELYLQELEQKLSISTPVLKSIMAELQRSKRNPSASTAYQPPEQQQPRSSTSENITVLEKTFLKALLESLEYGNEVLDFASSHRELMRLPHPAAAAILDHLVRRYREEGAVEEGFTLDITDEIGTMDSPEARDMASGLLIDPPLSSHWQEAHDERQQKAKRCLTAFLDSFRHLILDSFRQKKQDIARQLGTASAITHEEELTRQLNALLREEQQTEADVNAMIKSILH